MKFQPINTGATSDIPKRSAKSCALANARCSASAERARVPRVRRRRVALPIGSAPRHRRTRAMQNFF
jgi:hypothetical protein